MRSKSCPASIATIPTKLAPVNVGTGGELEQGGLTPDEVAQLTESKERLQSCVRRFDAAHLLEFTTDPKDTVGVFFVWKSGRT